MWVNTYRAVSYLSPFGGYKRSGIGRESGQEMIKEYLQTKSVWISTATEVPNPVHHAMIGGLAGTSLRNTIRYPCGVDFYREIGVEPVYHPALN